MWGHHRRVLRSLEKQPTCNKSHLKTSDFQPLATFQKSAANHCPSITQNEQLSNWRRIYPQTYPKGGGLIPSTPNMCDEDSLSLPMVVYRTNTYIYIYIEICNYSKVKGQTYTNSNDSIWIQILPEPCSHHTHFLRSYGWMQWYLHPSVTVCTYVYVYIYIYIHACIHYTT